MSLSTNNLIQCRDRLELAALLKVKRSTLTYYAYGNGKRYEQFEISKKSGGKRLISAPVDGLASIQNKLAVLLNDLYNGHSAAHGFLKEKSILSNASKHLNKKCVLNIDLEDFFPSITATRIIGLLTSKHFKINKEVAYTIAAICTHNNQLPQGAATSPVISNMISYRLDRELTALSRKEKTTYTRYADDITFSTTRRKFSNAYIKDVEEESVVLADKLESIILSNYFKINKDKVRLHLGTKPKFVTGVKVNTKPNLTRKYVRNLRSMIHSWEQGADNAQSKFLSTYNGKGKSIVKVVLGKLAHMKQIKGKDDLVYRRLFNRVMIIQGKYDEILPVEEIEELAHRIFVIKVGENKFGTGFILDSKWLITCAHVVGKGADEIKFFRHDRSSLPDQYHEADKNNDWVSPIKEFDVAALSIDSEVINDSNTLKSAPSSLSVIPGDECKIVGFPKYFPGTTPSMVEGKVIKVERNKYGIYDAYFDRTLVTGNSGGPVLNSQNQVIGMVRTGADNHDNTDDLGSTFLPIQELRKCLLGFER